MDPDLEFSSASQWRPYADDALRGISSADVRAPLRSRGGWAPLATGYETTQF